VGYNLLATFFCE